MKFCEKTLNSPGKVLENDLKKSWKVLEFDFAVSVATLVTKAKTLLNLFQTIAMHYHKIAAHMLQYQILAL